MGKHRMFSLDIIDCDEFLDMTPKEQTLYFHLGMRADDDGVVNNFKKIMRMCEATEEELTTLIKKKYIIPLQAGDSTIMVIKHWKIHNYIPKDRYTKSKYKEIIECLDIDENSAYRLPDTGCIRSVYEMYTSCIQTDNNLNTQDKISKDNLINILYPILSQSKHYQAALNREPGVLGHVRVSGITQEMLDEAERELAEEESMKELKEFK